MPIIYELEKISWETFVNEYKQADDSIYELMQIPIPGPGYCISIYNSPRKDEYYIQQAENPAAIEYGAFSILGGNLNLRFQDIFDYIVSRQYFDDFDPNLLKFELEQFYIDRLNMTTDAFLLLQLNDIQIAQGSIKVLNQL